LGAKWIGLRRKLVGGPPRKAVPTQPREGQAQKHRWKPMLQAAGQGHGLSGRFVRCNLGFVGVGIDGVECAEGVDQGGAGVHGHGDAEGFGDFLFGSAGFESSVGVEGDATVAPGSDGNGERDELADFLAKERVFGVGGGEGLVALERVGRELGEFGDGFRELGLIGVPIEENGGASCKGMLTG